MASEVDVDRVLRATNFAIRAHEGQYRTGSSKDPLTGKAIPYVSHCVEVAKTVAMADFSTHAIVVALLHDVVEDTPVTLAQVEEHFGEYVARDVGSLTLPEDCQKDWAKKAQHQIAMMKSMTESARAVKIADKLSNVSGMVIEPPPWGRKSKVSYILDARSVVLEASRHTKDPRVVTLIHGFEETCKRVLIELS